MNKIDDISFSVLISVYKKEKPEFFNEALDSVYTQTMPPSEVMICEDGKLSRELEAIIEKYKKRFPEQTRVIKYPMNRGLGKTLRDGILECSNEIIFRMDSDDISARDRFEKQLAIMQETKADVVGSNIVEYNEEMSIKTGKRVVPEFNNDIKRYARKRNPINHMTVCYRKSAVIDAGNYLAMDGFEDYFLWVRMINNGASFYNVQEPLVNVRGGGSMISRRGGLPYAKKIIAFEKELKRMKYISLIQYYANLIPRVAVSIIPSSFRRAIYTKGLRRRV